MNVPSWVKTNLSPELESGEEILGAEELRNSSIGRKLAVVATNQRRLVVEDGVFRTKVYPFSLELPEGATVQVPPTGMPEQPETTEEASAPESEETTSSEPEVEQTVEERAPEPSTGGKNGQAASELGAINGIGPARSTALADLGVTSFSELRTADPDTLAEDLGVNADTVRGWQGQADLTAVNGIGVTRSAQLVAAGFTTIDDLVGADADAVAKALDVTAETVAGWQAQADLTGIKGIGPTRAGQLRRSGVATIRQLTAADPESLADAVDVDASTVEGWQERAIESAIELTDLTGVDGIGPARARRLFGIGMTSQARLASGDTERIAEALDVSVDQVSKWQASANGDGS